MMWGNAMTTKLNKVTTGLAIVGMVLALVPCGYAKKKKPQEPPAPKKSNRVDHSKIDTSKVVWPLPPDVPRVRFLQEIYGESKPPAPAGQPAKKKQSWMDRVAGIFGAQILIQLGGIVEHRIVRRDVDDRRPVSAEGCSEGADWPGPVGSGSLLLVWFEEEGVLPLRIFVEIE